MLARPQLPLVSIVVPVLDEEECVGELVRRVRESLVSIGARYEILFVDDGSRDATPERIRALAHLARGEQEQAIAALEAAHARGGPNDDRIRSELAEVRRRAPR